MEDRADHLFVLDAEQAARELLVYGEGRSELPFDRLAGTADYLAPLLHSCNLIRHSEVCQRIPGLIAEADEGQIRRLVREFAEITLGSLEGLKAGENRDARADDALESLMLRLTQFAQDSNQGSFAPSSSRFYKTDHQPSADADRELIANAFRAIEAVDSLATMIAQEAHVQPTRIPDHTEDREANMPVVDQAADLANAVKPVSQVAESVAASPINARTDEDGHTEDDEPIDLGTVRSVSTTPTVAPVLTPVATAIEVVEKISTESVQASTQTLALSAEVPVRGVESVEIDSAFRKALRLAQDGPWMQGMTTLLEAIDVLDHVRLADCLPSSLNLIAGAEILVHPDLARMLGQELTQARVSGVADAMLVSQTLILAIQLDQFCLSDRIAKQIAWHGGRIEVDSQLRRWRVVVPSSSRLLRVTQLGVEGTTLAVPWAQFLGLEGKSPRQEAQLCIGNELDKLKIESLGLISTGVRFDLTKPLRRRERYRGLVMLSSGNCLPIYA